MRKGCWFRGALLSVLFFGVFMLLAAPSGVQDDDCPDCAGDFDTEIDVTGTVPDDPDDVEDVVVGNPVEPGSNSGYENLGRVAPDVPTQAPRGLGPFLKERLVKKIWNSLDDD